LGTAGQGGVASTFDYTHAARRDGGGALHKHFIGGPITECLRVGTSAVGQAGG